MVNKKSSKKDIKPLETTTTYEAAEHRSPSPEPEPEPPTPQIIIRKIESDVHATYEEEVKNAIYNQLKEDLEKKFKLLQITDAIIEIKFSNGQITDCKVTKFKGKKFRTPDLEDLFKQLIIQSSFTGTMKVTLEYK